MGIKIIQNKIKEMVKDDNAQDININENIDRKIKASKIFPVHRNKGSGKQEASINTKM